MTQIRELRSLKPGQHFTVFGMEEIFRNLKVLSISEGSVSVSGETSADDFEEKNGEKHRFWRPLSDSHTMSARTEVVVL
jgi:hypothetical protein